MYLLRLRRYNKYTMTNQTIQLEYVAVLNGTIKPPIDQNAISMTVKLIFSIVGMLMNMFVACVIIFNKRLRTKPRNIFLLGLVLSNISICGPVSIEFSYFISPSDELCPLYVAIVGLPYVLFLTNLLLALVDRYAAIVHPLWYTKNATVRLAVLSQLIASLFISIIYKFAYIAQFIPLHCEIQVIQVKINTFTFLILFSSCVVAQIIVYRRTKKILRFKKRKRETATESGVATNIPIITFNLVAQQIINPTDYLGESASPSEFSDSSINRLEMKATKALIVSVTSLSIVTGPILLFNSVMFVCRLYFENHTCISISWLALFLRGFIVLHVVIHPVFYLLRSTELSSTVKKWFER